MLNHGLGVMGYSTPPLPSNFTVSEELNYISPQLKSLRKIEFSFQHIMFFAYALVKLSIMFFYRRLFVVGRRSWSHIISVAIIIMVICWFFVFQFVFLLSCGIHIAAGAGWVSPAEEAALCPGNGNHQVEEAMTFSDLFLDLIIFFFPFPAIWSLHLDKGRKWALSSVFLVGLLAIVASILRLAYYHQILPHSNWAIDSNLVTSTAFYWSYLEAGLSLIAACMPSLSYLRKHRFLRSMVASARSALSLRSTKSVASQGTIEGSQVDAATKLPCNELESYGSLMGQAPAGMVSQIVPNNAMYEIGRKSEGENEVEEDVMQSKDFSQA